MHKTGSAAIINEVYFGFLPNTERVYMDVRTLLGVLRQYWLSILGLTVVGIVLAAAYVHETPPTYTAESQVFLSVQAGSSVADLNQGTTYAATVARNYAVLTTTPQVLDGVISDLNLDTTPQALASHVTATVPTNTSIISIDATSGSPQQAADIAQSTANSLIATVKELALPDANQNATIVATNVTPARVPTSPTSPNLKMTLALGLVVGLAIGIGQAVLRKVLNTAVYSKDDVAEVTDYAVMGRIPFSQSLGKDAIAIVNEPQSQVAEEYRRLHTNLSFMSLDSNATPVFVVTSSLPEEGKSTTSINVAFGFAEDGMRVLLIDGDLRRPTIAKYLNLENAAGLTTVLLGRAKLDEVVQRLGPGRVDVLPVGPTPPNPIELLGSEAMRHLVTQAAQSYDAIVIDSAPLLPVADTTLLASLATGTLLVVGAGKVKAPQLREAIASVTRGNPAVLGIVLNMTRRRHDGYHSEYYYDTYYGENGDQPAKPSGSKAVFHRTTGSAAPTNSSVDGTARNHIGNVPRRREVEGVHAG